MSVEGRTHPIAGHLQLAWAFAEILTRNERRAEALFREAVLEAKIRMSESEARPPRYRLLAVVRDVYYRGEDRPSVDGCDGGADAVCGRASPTALGHAVDVLADEDRELLFLRFGAELDLPAIGRISGRVPEAARARIVQLCDELQSRIATAVPMPDMARHHGLVPSIH